VIRRVRSYLGLALIAALLAGTAVVVLALVRGTWSITPVLSGSMRPGLPVGGVAVSQQVPMSQLAVRDVIVFSEPGHSANLVVHRIIQIQTNGAGQYVVRTQGDANTIPDPWTLTLQGSETYRVGFSLPLVGYAAVYGKTGLTDVIVGLILLVLAVGTARRLREGGEHEPQPSSRRPARIWGAWRPVRGTATVGAGAAAVPPEDSVTESGQGAVAGWVAFTVPADSEVIEPLETRTPATAGPRPGRR
jgi:signal peptidase